VDYIHYNPVKHGLARSAAEFQYSSFGTFVRQGYSPIDWGSGKEMEIGVNTGME
jgi:putative transposase